MKEEVKHSKLVGLSIFAVFYIIAYAAGFFAGSFVENVIWKLFLFDVVATVVIWFISLIIRNSSLYDAYWSLTPMIMAIYLIVKNYRTLNPYHYVLLAVFLIWSIRLTANWVITFSDFTWEDWRYKKYRELKKPLWHLANFFGIMLIPTLFVFVGFLPLFYFFTLKATALSLIGSAVILFGAALEFFADRQMHQYLRSVKEKTVCRNGLWKYSRHPNYLGEISIWVGVYLALLFTDYSLWYYFGGIVVMVFLFNVISIPLAEKRQMSRRPDYANYRKSTSRLLLLPPKKEQNATDNAS